MTKWAYDEDRTYHGVRDPETDKTRIEAERAEFGPTQRKGVIVLRLIRPVGILKESALEWGYRGTGPLATASAILADALGQEPSAQLLEAFRTDVVSQLTDDEWRLRRGAVLRWVRGWCAEHNIDVLPAAVAELPPIDPSDYGKLPEALKKERHFRIYGKPRQ
ncbi:DUF6166 domain-containing protein (plasmid) [Streptosporangium sandarakinum]|uniref:DUF6166 domain-containing protein n=1 Tax=Streptosporangium sandarakinum TaxID=1260955 RepID=UPI003D942A07